MEGSSSISKVTDLQTGGSLQYSDKDQRPNGEISVNSKEEVNHNISGVEKKVEVLTKQETVKPAPAENFWTTKSDGAVKLRMGSSGRKSIVPRTVVQLFEQAVRVAPNRVALAVKRSGEWVKWTYQEYYESTRCAAKSLIKLGLEPYHGVGILGFNSPEWIISDLGAIFAGGLAAGIYATNTPEACHYVAENCKANVIVVENDNQLKKILQVWDRLPHLKAVVQYTGEIKGEKPANVYTWKEFMELSKDVPDETLQARINNLVPNKCCTLIYTSGTTGNPKGVMLSHDNIVWNAELSMQQVQASVTEPSSFVSYLPLSHITAQQGDIFMPMTAAASVWFAQPDALKGTLVQTLKEVRPTYFCAVPRVYEKMIEKMTEEAQRIGMFKRVIGSWAKYVALQGNINIENGKPVPYGWTLATMILQQIRVALGLDRCKMAFVGAAPVTMQTLRHFQSINIPLYELFGMSESGGPHTISVPGHALSGSCGMALEGMETKVTSDEDGNGELCLQGRHVFMGYMNNEEKTKEALDEDGWLHTGDVAKIDKNGFVFITGRIKEIIITAGGENVAPIPIENNIKKELPIVSNAMVIGDKRKFLSCLLTLKVAINPTTAMPTDNLTGPAIKFCKSLGSNATTVSEILSTKDEKIMKAIQEGIDRANEFAVSRAQKIQKWTILEKDFSIPGGELGPTLKLKRPIVCKMFKEKIDAFYDV
ncbi:long-chain-fatty-acid--CoA ligase ACSBG2-like isoform X1 [Montipora capricornis]|uniref:long-chain-fatty-acid--CoA ligase ACSBG2-like isoform X1 n=1 Tax=Montipora capricornis TaxID=246305 RepID=UPI0035F18A07